MKTWKQSTFIGIVAILVLVLALVACDNGTTEEKDVTVIFNLDGGNIDGVETDVTKTVKSGNTVANLPNPKKEEYTFGGWFAEKDGNGNEFTATTTVTADITVFAKWWEKQSDIIYLSLWNIYTAKVEGYLTPTEWDGVAKIIESTINDIFSTTEDYLVKGKTEAVFYQSSATIIVEKNTNTLYMKYKIKDGEFKTLYLNYTWLMSATDDELKEILTNAFDKMATETPSIDGEPIE